jgi:hypothetical protein
MVSFVMLSHDVIYFSQVLEGSDRPVGDVVYNTLNGWRANHDVSADCGAPEPVRRSGYRGVAFAENANGQRCVPTAFSKIFRTRQSFPQN